MQRTSVLAILGVVLLLAGGSVWWLQAQAPLSPSLSAPTLTPNLVTVNTPTLVTATVSIPEPTLNPTTVELYRIAPDGSSLVAQMNDRGQDGDQRPGDKVFTALLTLNEVEPHTFGFQVSALFRGRNQVRSPVQQFPALAPSSVPVVLPPDPGEAGKATLEGIDSDGDGVRDDIQRYIVFEYPGSEKTRSALTQYIKSDQVFLQYQDDEQGAIDAARARQLSSDCVYYIMGESRESFSVVDNLEATFLNTVSRSKAYLKADAHLGGEVFHIAQKDEMRAHCSFDPETMEN